MKLLFVHGSGGCKESWQYQTQYFEGSEAINLPGHPDGEPCGTIDEYVEWLHGYVTDRGYVDLVIAGHSLGGGIALLYGMKHSGSVKGLITVGSGGRLRVHPKYLEDLEKAVADPASNPASAEAALDHIKPGLRAIITSRYEENGPAVRLNDFLACDGFDILDRLSDIDVPLLAICGTEDIMTPPKYSQYMADNMRNARTAIIPGGTHYVFAEKPEEVNRAVEAFLKSIQALPA